MLRSILIGVDGSTHSDAALALGLRWASRYNALLVGLGVIDQPSICQATPVPIGGGHYKQRSDEKRLAQARAQVEQFLGDLSVRSAAANVALKLLEDTGHPYEVIAQEAQRYDLIVLGQQTHFEFATRTGPDGTLTRVLKDTPRPVVTVPERLPDATGVVIAYDGSLQAARAVQAFQGAGLAAGCEVHVVGVGTERQETGRHVDRALDFLSHHGVRAARHVLAPGGSVADTLLTQVRELNAGLLVMGCYGQSTLREFFLGSVTRTVLEQAPVPLFLYH